MLYSISEFLSLLLHLLTRHVLLPKYSAVINRVFLLSQCVRVSGRGGSVAECGGGRGPTRGPGSRHALLDSPGRLPSGHGRPRCRRLHHSHTGQHCVNTFLLPQSGNLAGVTNCPGYQDYCHQYWVQ